MEHSFDIAIAERYGIPAAVLLKNIHFWIEKNRANGKNYFDGYFWTYNSKKAFAELFPYMTARQIDYALQKLIEEDIVITGNYNKVAYDRTLWYAITKKGYSILQNCEMEETKLVNGRNDIVQPIPDSNSDIYSNNNSDIGQKRTRFTPPTLEEVQAYCKERRNGVNAERFIDYYTSNGWRVGKNKMKDWKAAVRTWERNGFSAKTYGASGIAVKPNEPDDLDDIF